jgi:hypothetical protein
MKNKENKFLAYIGGFVIIFLAAFVFAFILFIASKM